mmetsp:Transcript_24788/g.61993  ORF Transcript_24788/g.61993 Transcript_24788/m.61993 type:complete len:150 (+) Transcript_24788:188-637(+)
MKLLLANLDDLALEASTQSCRAALEVIEWWPSQLGLSIHQEVHHFKLKPEDTFLLPEGFGNATKDGLELSQSRRGARCGIMVPSVSSFLRRRLLEPLHELGVRLVNLGDARAACSKIRSSPLRGSCTACVCSLPPPVPSTSQRGGPKKC